MEALSGSPLRAERDIYSVSRLNREVRVLLERGFGILWVEAEISNFSRPSSGHWYFSLKDANAQVRCAMFRTAEHAVRVHRPRRPEGAGACPHRALRAAGRVPAHRRAHGRCRRRRVEAPVRGARREAQGGRPVRGRAQARVAVPAAAHRRHHLALRRRGARYPARTRAALSRRGGDDLSGGRAGRCRRPRR